METFYNLIGSDHEKLNYLQMSLRAVIIFILTLTFLRLAGRRSFGMGSPMDNVVSILLGSILSRTVVGASPFFPTLGAALALALMHRIFAMIGLYSSGFGSVVKGNARIIYENGKINRSNMNWSLISDKDLMEGIRKEANVESLEDIKKVYVERDGKISVIKYVSGGRATHKKNIPNGEKPTGQPRRRRPKPKPPTES